MKARNWGQGGQVTVGKGSPTPRTKARMGFGLHSEHPVLAPRPSSPVLNPLGRGLPWGGGWVSRRSELEACPSTPYLGCLLQILRA